MKVLHNIAHFQARNPVVTIGIFDGVHIGHVQILNRIKELAALCNGESVVITLWPHPRFVLQPDNTELKLLASLEEKIVLIEKQKIDNLVILPFDRQLANMTYDRFINTYIVGHIHARHIVVGFNHHFGKDRQGTFEKLLIRAKENGIQAERLNQVVVDDMHVSSSGIRHMIEEGRITAANKALGYAYFISGTVIEGNKLGRTMGYPTANIALNETKKLLPRNGVYAVVVTLKEKQYQGMLSIGVRPTIDLPRHDRIIEVHIFGFNETIYGVPIKVSFLEWLRCERKFPGLLELKNQIDADKEEVIRIFQNSPLKIH